MNCMFERYPMNHYEFSDHAGGIEQYEQTVKMTPEETENYALIINADYRLQGYVDVLRFFPSPDDAFRRGYHLQSFSRMYSNAEYYTSRTGSPSFLILYTIAGGGILTYGGNTYRLKEGDLFWIDCGQPHTYRTDGPFWDHTDMHISGTGVQTLYEEFSAGSHCVLRAGQIPFLTGDTEAVLDAYSTPASHRTMRTAHCIETLLYHLILAADETLNRQPQKTVLLQNLIAYMHEHFREPLTMDALSDLCGLSKYHLSREFCKLTGFPPIEYLIRLRLEEARVLLAGSALPVCEIARLSGIENEAYFSRLFHQRMHMTPGAYRKQTAGKTE